MTFHHAPEAGMRAEAGRCVETVVEAADGLWCRRVTEIRHGFERVEREAAAVALEALDPPAAPRPVAAFVGLRHERRVSVPPAPGAEATAQHPPSVVALRLRVGAIRAVAREWPCARLSLRGPPEAVARLALALSASVALAPALEGLGHAALSRVADAQAPCLPDPPLRASTTVDEAIAETLGGLARALVAHAPAAAAGDFEAVHRMRVATRRMRSALLVFRAPLGGTLDADAALVAALAAALGRARDWDVFVVETGAAILRGMDGDRRVAALLAGASRRRAEAHARLARELASPRLRRLALRLSLLATARPWREGADAPRAALLDTPLAAFAPVIVARRVRRLVRGAPDLGALAPDALHDRRKAAKKLRYATEFVGAALPPGRSRRLLRRLARTQARLGAINDVETGAALVARLARAGDGSADEAFAAGAVHGFLAARGAQAREGLARDWSRLRRQRRFWRRQAG